MILNIDLEDYQTQFPQDTNTFSWQYLFVSLFLTHWKSITQTSHSRHRSYVLHFPTEGGNSQLNIQPE